jgi:multisubunit Na+/H+ antiporter MnhE subunit
MLMQKTSNLSQFVYYIANYFMWLVVILIMEEFRWFDFILGIVFTIVIVYFLYLIFTTVYEKRK